MIQFLKGLRPSDPVFVLVAFSVGVLWLWLRPSSKAPRRCLLALVVGYWFAALPLGASLLLAGLSTGMPRVESREAARGADAVVVLGGGAATVRVGGIVSTALTGAARLRAIEGARVFTLIGARLIVVSGGMPDGSKLLQPESEALQSALVAVGVPATAIVQESGSKTTRDQARLVAPLLRAHNVRRFVLVTSPAHMRRSLAVFRAEGLDPVPSSAPLRSEHLRPPLWLLPDSESLWLSDQAAYEYATFIYYWGSGQLRAGSR